MVCHSSNRIDRVVYVGASKLEEYCAVSGSTLYSGKSDAETTLKAQVTQIWSFQTSDGTGLIAAAMGKIGEIQILDGLTLESQLQIRHTLMSSIEDFIVIVNNQEFLHMEDENDINTSSVSHSMIILSQENLIKCDLI